MSPKKYCLFVDRKTETGLDIIGFPSDDFDSLKRVANGIVQLPYVSNVTIAPKNEGWPLWGSALYERKRFGGWDIFREERKFYEDLSDRLSDVDKRFLDTLYRGKGKEFEQLVEERSPRP